MCDHLSSEGVTDPTSSQRHRSGIMASNTTQDHDFIREWAEKRGGKPAEVASTEQPDQPGILRLEFPGAPNANDDALKEIEWDEFFEKFDRSGLEFLYQEETAEGELSNFNKLIYPEPDSAAGEKLLKKTAGKKGSAKKSTAKKGATVKASGKKVAAKTVAAKKTSSAKKTAPAKKSAAKKAAAKKTVAKKAPGKKVAAKKIAVKASAAKKTGAKKTAAKKTVGKKVAGKKSAR